MRRPGDRHDPLGPLARGRLARDWDEATGRSASDPLADMLYTEKDSDHAIIDAVGDIAAARGVPGPRSPWPGCTTSPPPPPLSSA